MGWLKRLVVAAVFVLAAVPARAQVPQPTGCPDPYRGNVCLGSGGADLDTIIMAGGEPALKFGRTGKSIVLLGTWAISVSSALLTDPTITVSTGSFKLGLPSQAAGDILYADAATTYTRLAKGTASQFLIGGTVPSWGTILASTALATTSTDGLVLSNTTAATGGATVQMSPRFRWRGTAWNTAASQTVDFFAEALPASAATPTGTWKLGYSLAGGAATYPFQVTSAGQAIALDGSAAAPSFTTASDLTTGFNRHEAGAWDFTSAATRQHYIGNGVFGMISSTVIQWANSASDPGAGADVKLSRSGGAVLKIGGSGSAYGSADALSFLSSGTPITSGTTFLSSGSGMGVANVGANSCGTTAATIAGNNNLFTVTVGATAGTQCRVAFTVTATTAWGCTANDDTTTVAVRTTPVDTTHLDLIGTFTAGDQITAICLPR